MNNYIEAPYHDDRELPYFNLRALDLPEVSKWEIGGEYYLVMKVEMTDKRRVEDKDKEQKKIEGGFRVKSVRALKHTPVDLKSMEKEDFNKAVTKAKSGEY